MIPKYLLDTNNPISVIVHGAGGTGSFLASHLARMMTYMHLFGMEPFDLCIVDNDLVNETNTMKQMYLPWELGKMKSVALSSRLNRAYNLDIGIYKNDKHFAHIHFGCTDSLEFRSKFNPGEDSIYIDCGNAADYGQVVVSCKAMGWPSLNDLGERNYDNEIASCGDLKSFMEQKPSINPIIASLAFDAFYTLVIQRTIPNLRQYINLSNGTMQSSNDIVKKKEQEQCQQSQRLATV